MVNHVNPGSPGTLPALWRGLMARLSSETGRQTVVLYGAQLVSMALNFAFTIVVGRAMTQDDFGIFSFCVFSIILFPGYLFEFGVFAAGARLLAIAPNRDEERRLLGALAILGVAIAAAFAILVALLGPLVDFALARFGYSDTSVASVLVVVAPLAMGVPLQLLVENACLGTNRIGLLAVLRLALPTASISAISILHAATGAVSVRAGVAAYLGGLLASAVTVGFSLRPAFAIRRDDFARIAAAVREYGFDLYVGRVVTIMSVRLDQLLIPYFVGPRRFGAFSIAQRISEPVSGLARALATTRFKAFAGEPEVRVSLVRWNIALLAGASLSLATAGPWLIIFAFPGKFMNSLPLLLPFAIAALFGGLLQPYNLFLAAHGAGRSLRDLSLVIGVLNLAGLFVFTRRYGLAGAAWFAVASMAVNFLLHLYAYRRLLRQSGVSERIASTARNGAEAAANDDYDGV